MCLYSWRPGIEHDWLSVDEDGRVGYFMSAYADALPVSISIPWQYLHNLAFICMAYHEQTSCADVRRRYLSSPYPPCDDLVKNLLAMGLSVWDAVIDQGGGFRKVASPARNVSIQELPVFFQRVARSFCATHVSFEKAGTLYGLDFENHECVDYHHIPGRACNELTDPVACEALLTEMESVKKGDIPFVFADRCRIDEMPRLVGPTFTCEDAARFCYCSLVEQMVKRYGCLSLKVGDDPEMSCPQDLSQLSSLSTSIGIPFPRLILLTRDGRKVVLSQTDDSVVEYCSCPTIQDPLSGHAVEPYVEDWKFELHVEGEVKKRPWYSLIKAVRANYGRHETVFCQI